MPKVRLNAILSLDPTFLKLSFLAAVVAGLHQANGVSYAPGQVTQAYSLNGVTFGSAGVAANGAGQTIAIIDWYNDANIQAEAAKFNSVYGIQAFGAVGGPTLSVVNQTGGTSLPTTNTTSLETALDVEYAHAMAPQANILLVEPNSGSFSDTDAGVNYAKAVPGVSVISMSYGASDTGGSYASYDSTFTQASNHLGVTFVASTGDSQSPSYPSTSLHVVALGGTHLTVNGSNNRSTETLWANGEGTGYSAFEARPTFQNGVSSATYRSVPDVSMDADPNTGVNVYFGATPTLNSGVGGTSVAAPLFAGLMADADQGRSVYGLPPLTSDQTLTDLYGIYNTPQYASSFYDVTSGTSNGYTAATGFDVASGLGAPVASGLLPYLATLGAVPEPASMAVLLVPAVLLGRRRRKVSHINFFRSMV